MRTDPAYWVTAIAAAKEFRTKYSNETRWDDLDRYYRNDWGADQHKQPNFNLVFMHGRSLLPSLLFSRPHILNSPRKPSFLPWASFFDSIDNWICDEIEVEGVFTEAALYCYLYNIGAVQLGFDFVENDLVLSQEKMREYAGFAPIENCPDRTRRKNFPWLDLVEPNRLLFPWGTKTMRNCPWFAKIVCLSVDRLAEYGITVDEKKTTTYSPTLKESEEINQMIQKNANDKFVVFYEIHNAVTKQVCWLSADGTMLKDWEKDDLQIDGLPMETMVFNPNTKSIWGTSDALYIEPQMLDGNDCRKMGMKQRRVALLKMLVDSNMLSEEELEKMYSDDALPAIRIKNLGERRLTDAVALLQPHIQSEFFMYQKQLMEDSQLMLGFGPNQLGTFAPGRRTKFEAQVVEERNFIRINERREIIGKAITGIFRKINQLVVKNWNQLILQRVIGVDGAMYWVEAKPKDFSDLRAELVTKVDVESMAPMSSARIKQEMIEVLGLVGKLPNTNTVPLVRELLSKFPWADVNAMLPQAPQTGNMPMETFQQQQQQMMDSPQMGTQLRQNLQPFMQMMPARMEQRQQVRRKANAPV